MLKDKLLIVDDENAELMGIIYADFGFEVFTASDGRTAVETAARIRPDLVLLDIKIPVLDGFEVLEELKKREIETRVVMYSAYLDYSDTAIRCIKSGACDFVHKLDMLPEEMAERIRKYILVEKTLNLRVSDTTPVVDKLIHRTEKLTIEVDKLESENARWKTRNYRAEIITKSVYITLSIAAVCLLFRFGLVKSGLEITFVFIVLFILLMIPIDRIQRISAQLAKLKTKIRLKD